MKSHKKQKLWNKLQSLDRKISNLPRQLICNYINNKLIWVLDKESKAYIKLDTERKKVRTELKNSHNLT
jgi:hypothetical protein